MLMDLTLKGGRCQTKHPFSQLSKCIGLIIRENIYNSYEMHVHSYGYILCGKIILMEYMEGWWVLSNFCLLLTILSPLIGQ